MAQVSGKVAIVTGGASGIGEACAETLAREGASVLITDIDDTLGKGVVERITKAGGKAHLICATTCATRRPGRESSPTPRSATAVSTSWWPMLALASCRRSRR